MWPRRIETLLVLGAMFLFGCAFLDVHAQRSDAGQGVQRFMEYCAGCHGADARGGDKAPALVSASNTTNRSDSELFRIVHDGTKGGMPPFAQIGDANIRAVVQFLRRLENSAASKSASAEATVTGDVDAGRTLYFGKAQCSKCHLMQGKGGFIARNLTAYGRNRTADEILHAITTPDTPLDALIASSDGDDQDWPESDRSAAQRRQLHAGTADRRRPLSFAGEERRHGCALHRALSDAARLQHAAFAEGTQRHCQFSDCREQESAPGQGGGSMTCRAREAVLTMSKLRSTRMRFVSRVLRALVAVCLLLVMHAGSGYGQTEQPETHSAGKHATPPDDANGLINVQQSDLLQRQVTDNWVSYNGDYSGARYSSLTQITPGNVGRLAAQWVFHPRVVSPLEVTPVVVAGVMFVTSANDAYALDAKTGKVLWHHVRAISQGLVGDPGQHHNRGVAILGTRVYMETDNAHLLCLDARSGHLIWEVPYATGNRNYGATSAPLIVKDKVVVGISGGDRRRARLPGCLRCGNGRGEMAVLDHPRARREGQ